MDVREIMTQAVITAAPNDTVASAFEKLEDQQIRHLPVVDDGTLVGMISDRDLREYRVPLLAEVDDPEQAEALMNTPLSDLMRGDVIALDEGQSVTDAIDLMVEHGIGAVPVMDRHTDELQGIVSYVDILRALRTAI
jgi:acetoin utilization protein AcuB